MSHIFRYLQILFWYVAADVLANTESPDNKAPFPSGGFALSGHIELHSCIAIMLALFYFIRGLESPSRNTESVGFISIRATFFDNRPLVGTKRARVQGRDRSAVIILALLDSIIPGNTTGVVLYIVAHTARVRGTTKN